MDIENILKIFSSNWNLSIGKKWVPFGIIAITLLASFVVSYWGSIEFLMLIPVLLSVIAVVLALLRKPALGIVLVFVGGMFVPIAGPSGLNAAVVMVALLMGLWFMDMLVVKRNFQLIRSRVLPPVVFFLVISVLSLGLGQIPWFTFTAQAPLNAQLGGFAIFVLSLGAMLVTQHIITSTRWIEIVVWSFIVLGTFYILGRTARVPFIDHLYDIGFSAGSMFWTWFVALCFSQAVCNTQLKPRIRVLLMVIVLMTLYVAMVQGYDWKSGWLPPLVSVAVILGIRFKRLTLFAIPVGLIFFTYVVVTLIALEDYSWGTRVDAWKILLEISRVSPLLGLGFSNYYWYTPLFPIRGYEVSFNSHSQYVDLIAQTGYLGLFCFIWVFFAVGRLSWDLLRKLPNGFAQAYTYAVFAGIVGTLVSAFMGDWVLPFVYNLGLTGFRASILPWIFLGCVLSVEQMVQQNQKVEGFILNQWT